MWHQGPPSLPQWLTLGLIPEVRQSIVLENRNNEAYLSKREEKRIIFF